MRVLIACGGTAGHIFPGLALAEELKDEDEHTQIVMVVSSRARDRDIFKAGGPLLKEVHIETVGTIALPYKFSPIFIPFALKLFWAFLKSFIIILRYAPQVVVGFGGYTSFAPLIVARLINIPTLIHEQNLMPGRANRILARAVNRIAVTFEQTYKFFPQDAKLHHRIVKTGLPLRKRILDYQRDGRDIVTAAPGKFTLLVVGGSQGAHNINELVLNCLGQMDKASLAHLRLIHLTGKGDFRYAQQKYAVLGVEFRVFDFLEDMASVYRVADLMISRSGASTIFEAAVFGLPCILIPYSYGTHDQKENALHLERLGAALVLDEQTSSSQDLKKILQRLIGDERLREDLSQKIKLLETPGASRNLKEQVNALYSSRYVEK